MQGNVAFANAAMWGRHKGGRRNPACSRFTPTSCSSLPSRIELSQRNVLYFGSQRIGDSGAKIVADALAIPGNQIQSVNLDGCDITCDGACAIARSLAVNSTLEELVLYNNRIGDRGAAAIAEALTSEACHVRNLSMPQNCIGAAGGVALGGMLRQNKSLQTIYLMGQTKKGGGIGDNGAKAFADGIKHNAGAFWFVNLAGNGISSDGLALLRDSRSEKHVVFPVDPYPR